MRPRARFLSDDLADKIVDEAMEVLCALGVELHNPGLVAALADRGAKVDGPRVVFTHDIIESALNTVPGSFQLHDVYGEQEKARLGGGEAKIERHHGRGEDAARLRRRGLGGDGAGASRL